MPRVFKQVSCGMDHTLVLDSYGVVYSAGNSRCGQLGINPGFMQADMTVVEVETFTPERPCVMVSAGTNFSLALSASGQVFSCGLNANGRLGHPKNFLKDKPFLNEFTIIDYFAHSGIHITNIAAGGKHCIAVSSGNKRVNDQSLLFKPNIYLWGLNYQYQLGQGYGNREDCYIPKLLGVNPHGKV